MVDRDKCRWEYNTRKIPIPVVTSIGKIAFGWRMVHIEIGQMEKGWRHVAIDWTRDSGWMSFVDLSGRPFRFRAYPRASLRDLWRLGRAWLQSHKSEATVIALAVLTISVCLFGITRS